MTTTACTIGPDATTGKRCGAPAVVTFTTRTGETFGECEAHAAHATPPPPPVVVGATVTVYHAGLRKAGTVVAVRRTLCEVRVPSRGATKIITVPIAEVV